MKQTICKSEINGQIHALPSKSCEQRILVAALLSRGECQILNQGNSEDVIFARKIIETLGCKISIENDILKLSAFSSDESDEIDCGESAMNARLFASVACMFKNKFTITGKGSLLQRPIASDFYVFRQMGVVIENYTEYLPISFTQTNLLPGTYNIDGSKTSQLISGLMMTLAVLPSDSELIVHNPVSIDYINLSVDIMKYAGVKCEMIFNEFGNLIINIPGNQIYNSATYKVEGDWSGAANILVAAALTGQIKIVGLNGDSKQADKNILSIFDKAGVSYSWEGNDLSVKKTKIKTFEFDAKNCPDLIPIAIVLACFSTETCLIKGANRLKHKESSRAEVMQQELKKSGVIIEISDDDIFVYPSKEMTPAKFDSHNDHRIAMALSIFSLAINGESTIKNAECVSKSYPSYYFDLKKIGLK